VSAPSRGCTCLVPRHTRVSLRAARALHRLRIPALSLPEAHGSCRGGSAALCRRRRRAPLGRSRSRSPLPGPGFLRGPPPGGATNPPRRVTRRSFGGFPSVCVCRRPGRMARVPRRSVSSGPGPIPARSPRRICASCQPRLRTQAAAPFAETAQHSVPHPRVHERPPGSVRCAQRRGLPRAAPTPTPWPALTGQSTGAPATGPGYSPPGDPPPSSFSLFSHSPALSAAISATRPRHRSARYRIACRRPRNSGSSAITITAWKKRSSGP